MFFRRDVLSWDIAGACINIGGGGRGDEIRSLGGSPPGVAGGAGRPSRDSGGCDGEKESVPERRENGVGNPPSGFFLGFRRLPVCLDGERRRKGDLLSRVLPAGFFLVVCRADKLAIRAVLLFVRKSTARYTVFSLGGEYAARGLEFFQRHELRIFFKLRVKNIKLYAIRRGSKIWRVF